MIILLAETLKTCTLLLSILGSMMELMVDLKIWMSSASARCGTIFAKKLIADECTAKLGDPTCFK